MALGRARITRREDERGAASQRLLLALAASAVLTAAVSLPMAYQAHEARTTAATRAENDPQGVEVMGTTTVRPPEAITDAIVWQLVDTEPQLLHLAQVPGEPRIFLDGVDAVRADFRLDDGPVQSDTTEPFELDDGAPVELVPGAHSVTVTVTFDDGRSSLHQAFFTAVG
jgi:hypothetical protein